VDPHGFTFAGDSLIGTSLFCLGDLTGARRYLEPVHNTRALPTRSTYISDFQMDLPVTANVTLSKLLWLQGFPDQAVSMAEANVEEACALNRAISVCNALDAATVIALAVGDLPRAEQSIAMLLERSAKHALGFWRTLGHCFRAQAMIARGDVVIGAACLRSRLDEFRETGFILRHLEFLGALSEGLAEIGRLADALQAVDEALAQCESTDARCNIADLLRVKGKLLMLQTSKEAQAAAEQHFLQSLGWALQQEALSWELRTATSLARLWSAQRRTREARELLSTTYGRFTEGFETADLKAARALLNALQ
jgi:hypothetical protein